MEATKASHDCWNICRPHVTIMITIFPEQETSTCKYRTKRNHAWPVKKKKKNSNVQTPKTHSEPREDFTLLFIFPDLAYTKLLFIFSKTSITIF